MLTGAVILKELWVLRIVVVGFPSRVRRNSNFKHKTPAIKVEQPFCCLDLFERDETTFSRRLFFDLTQLVPSAAHYDYTPFIL